MSEDERGRRARWFMRALEAKTVLHFPQSGWPGWTDEELERRRIELDETLADVSERLPLDVSERDDGTVVVRSLASLN